MDEQEVRIHIDVQEMTLGDLELLEEFQAGGRPDSVKGFVALLERIAVVEGVPSARQLKVRDLRKIGEAIQAGVAETTNPKN